MISIHLSSFGTCKPWQGIGQAQPELYFSLNSIFYTGFPPWEIASRPKQQGLELDFSIFSGLGMWTCVEHSSLHLPFGILGGPSSVTKLMPLAAPTDPPPRRKPKSPASACESKQAVAGPASVPACRHQAHNTAHDLPQLLLPLKHRISTADCLRACVEGSKTTCFRAPSASCHKTDTA